MKIRFASNGIQKVCQEEKKAVKKYNQDIADGLALALDNLLDSENLEEAKLLPGNLHALKHDRSKQFGVTVYKRWRLIFEANQEDPPPYDESGNVMWRAIHTINVLGVEDYHKNK